MEGERGAGSEQPGEAGPRPPEAGGGRRLRRAGCGVVIRVEGGLDVQVASPPLPSLLFLSLHASPLPFFLFSTTPPFAPPLPLSPTLPSAPLSPGLWPVRSGAEYPSGSRGCLAGVSQLRRRGEDGGGGGGLRGPLGPERTAGSTTDSASPLPEAPTRCGPCAPAMWAPNPGAGGSRCPPSRLLLPGGLPCPSTNVPAPQAASRHCAESPGSGLRLWRPW